MNRTLDEIEAMNAEFEREEQAAQYSRVLRAIEINARTYNAPLPHPATYGLRVDRFIAREKS